MLVGIVRKKKRRNSSIDTTRSVVNSGKLKGGESMLEQNTDRSGWAMVALVVLGAALLLVEAATSEIGELILEQIKALFTG